MQSIEVELRAHLELKYGQLIANIQNEINSFDSLCR